MSQGIQPWFPGHIAANLFMIAFLLWAACEVFNTLGLRLGRQTAIIQQSDQGSYWIILLVHCGLNKAMVMPSVAYPDKST
jgi:hypothetical protein